MRDELTVGMVLAQDLTDANGALIVPCGREVTPTLLARLRNFRFSIDRTRPAQLRTPPAGGEHGPPGVRERVRGLLALAEDAGASGPEAATAPRKAWALLRRYRLRPGDVEGRHGG